ncbi:MAG: hypothetical protein EXR62_04440 [Chloroflexi bacterium]|nr:hypothetical protein [Chloroflexota bacterium]
MGRKRIQVYIDPETKRRIELAAAKRQMAVTEYCLEAIKQQLLKDDMLKADPLEIPVRKTKGADLITDLRSLHARILADRQGEPIDVDTILEQMRDEREDEILGLR